MCRKCFFVDIKVGSFKCCYCLEKLDRFFFSLEELGYFVKRSYILVGLWEIGRVWVYGE